MPSSVMQLYVSQLSNQLQEIIKSELYQQGFDYEDIERALNSRVQYLSDTIDFDTLKYKVAEVMV